MTELGKPACESSTSLARRTLATLLGVDPFDMYQGDPQGSIGVEQVTLSSDCGEPLFPILGGRRQANARLYGKRCSASLSKEEIKKP